MGMKDQIYIEAALDWAQGIIALPAPESCSDAVWKAKFEAVRESIGLARYYREQGIRPDLVRTVFEKRMALIKASDSVRELREIAAPPRPYYTGRRFISRPTDVPEEEMILWSLTLLKAPLNVEGLARYAELFRQAFGADI